MRRLFDAVTSNIRRPGALGALNSLASICPGKSAAFQPPANWRSFTGARKITVRISGIPIAMQFAWHSCQDAQDWSRRRTGDLETWHKRWAPGRRSIDNPA